MAKLSDWGERRIVRELLGWYGPSADAGIGDDAAIVPVDGTDLLVSTDVLNPATHVPEGATPSQVGWYLVAVNFSDIAAMGGEPVGFLAALTLPRDMDTEDLAGLAEGMRACAEAYGARVLGGDTKEGEELSLAGVAIGRAPDSRVLRRTGCAPGDVLAVTGTLGRGGWAARRLGADGAPDPVEVLLRVRPRVQEGRFLAGHGGVTACMDISDGLAASLAQLAEASDVAFRVEFDRVPADALLEDVSAEEREDALLYKGGDFELLFTVRSDAWDELAEAMGTVGTPITAIGEVLPRGPNLVVAAEGEQELAGRGYEHFVA